MDGAGGDGAGGCAAGEGGTNTTFPDLDVERVFFGAGDEADVGAFAKGWVVGQVLGSLLKVDGWFEEDDVGIADGSCGGAQGLVLPEEGSGGWGHDGAHVDLDLGQGAGGVEVDKTGLDSVIREDF